MIDLGDIFFDIPHCGGTLSVQEQVIFLDTRRTVAAHAGEESAVREGHIGCSYCGLAIREKTGDYRCMLNRKIGKPMSARFAGQLPKNRADCAIQPMEKLLKSSVVLMP
jgi:hypothetical protein